MRYAKEKVNDALEARGFCYLKSGADTPNSLDGFVKLFGVVMRQYDGDESSIVQPQPGFEDSYYSNSRSALFPHTEAYELETPPRLIVLHCINPDRYQMGYTPICDMRPFITGLGADDREELKTRAYLFHANEGLSRIGQSANCNAPFLKYSSDDEWLFRFSYNNVKLFDTDYFGKKFVNAVMEFFNGHKQDIFLERNDILVLDNRRMLHGRTSFVDMNRQIRRMWVG